MNTLGVFTQCSMMCAWINEVAYSLNSLNASWQEGSREWQSSSRSQTMGDGMRDNIPKDTSSVKSLIVSMSRQNYEFMCGF